MTREEQNQAQALDLEERQRQAEHSFEAAFRDWTRFTKGWMGKDAREEHWATIASEMGISEFYRKLKEGK